MLTFTYSLVTLSIEQKKARGVLTGLQQHFQRCSKEPNFVDRSGFEAVLNQLAKFDESYHRRNVELYVIPAVREVTQEANSLLNELEAISNTGANILHAVRERICDVFEQGGNEIKELCSSMDFYCRNLLERLTREEKELFPIAQRVISNEGWFDLASQFISHDAEVHAYKPSIASNPAAASEWRSVRLSPGSTHHGVPISL